MADIVYATEKSVYIIASTNQQKSAKLVSYTTNANNPFDMHTITDLSDYVDTFIYSNGTISQAPIIDDTIIYPFARASSTGSGDGGGYITFRIAENGLNVIKSELIWESNSFNGSVQALAREDGTILEIICAAYSSSANLAIIDLGKSSCHGFALQNGVAGDIIKVGYVGEYEVIGAVTGETYTSGNNKAYSFMDGKISISGYWN